MPIPHASGAKPYSVQVVLFFPLCRHFYHFYPGNWTSSSAQLSAQIESQAFSLCHLYRFSPCTHGFEGRVPHNP